MTDPTPITATLPNDEDTHVSAATPSQPDLNRAHLRRELQWALWSLGFGLFVLPGLIYVVGTLLLGPYGGAADGSAHVGSFYGDVFRGLATPSISAWSIALGPLVIVVLLRLILIRWPTTASSGAVVSETPEQPHVVASTERAGKHASRNDERREPFIGS
jgi:hypothetical protein